MGCIVAIFWNRREGRLRALWRLVLQALLVIAQVLLVVWVCDTIEATAGVRVIPHTLPGRAILSGLTVLVSIYVAGRFLDRRRFIDFGFHFDRNWWIDLAFGFVLGGSLVTCVFLIEFAAGWVTVTEVLATRDPDIPFALAILLPVVLFVLVGVNEEMLSQGYHLTNLAEGLNWWRIGPRASIILALLLSSVGFSLFHAGNPHMCFIGILDIALAGIVMGLGYVLTGELAIPIGLHIAWNFFESNVYGFPISGYAYVSATVIATEQHGPELWVGGAFGPESGLLALGVLLAGSTLIPLWVKLRYGQLRLHVDIAAAPARAESRGEIPGAGRLAAGDRDV